MKRVTIGKQDYDRVVYQVIATASNANTPLLRTQGKVLDKLEARGVSAPANRAQETLCDNCKQVFLQTDPTRRPPPMFEMTDLSAEFSFEDGEAEYIIEKLEEALPRLQGRVSRGLVAILDALDPKAMDDTGIAKEARVESPVEIVDD